MFWQAGLLTLHQTGSQRARRRLRKTFAPKPGETAETLRSRGRLPLGNRRVAALGTSSF